MKAMIFAAGLGSRLRPITNTMPKALVSVEGKPLLEIVINKLKEAGFDEIIINIHHFGEQIIHFLELNNNFGIRIEISDERDFLSDTGGGIKKAAPFFDNSNPFLIHNVDILSNLDLGAFYQKTLHSNAYAHLVVSNRTSSRYLLFNKNDELVGWMNEKTKEIKSPYKNIYPKEYKKYAFGGIHILSPSIFNLMEPWPLSFSIIDFYLSICHKVPIKAYIEKNLELIDVGKIETLNSLNK